VKQNRHTNSFIQRVLERYETAINGKLIHAAANLPSVLEQHEHKNGTPKPDTQAPVVLRHGAGRWHSASILHHWVAVRQITKVRNWCDEGSSLDLVL
jgi:hypothetical protein